LKGQTVNPEFKTEIVENELWKYLSESKRYTFRDRSYYAYQYSLKLEGSVLIHGYCNHHPNGSEVNFFDNHILDGGSCYFSVFYNLKRKTFSNLFTHGEA
jgi:hypothetical protein